MRAGPPYRFEDVERTDDIRIRIEDGIGNALPHVDLRRKMHDNIKRTVSDDSSRFGRSDAHLVQNSALRDIGAIPCRQIIDDLDLVALREKQIRNMRADESCATGY